MPRYLFQGPSDSKGGLARTERKIPLPKQQKNVYGDPRADYQRVRGALAGFTGLGDRPSVMEPETADIYDKAELIGILSQLSPLAKVVGTTARVATTPSGIARYLAGHSPKAITAKPASLRRVEPMSDDFYQQLADAKAAQASHYEKLKARYPDNTPQPADILSEMIDSPHDGRILYEVTSPSRGWTVVDPKSGYVAGILSEGRGGESIVNPTFNALNRMYDSPLKAVAASQELAEKYRSLGLPVGVDWGIKVPKVRHGNYASGTPGTQRGAIGEQIYHPNVDLPLTKAEEKALSKYIENSLPLNYSLQEGKLTASQTKQAEVLDKLIEQKGLSFDEPYTFYRGVNSPDMGRSFLSVTPDRELASRFGEVTAVDVPAGIKMLPVSGKHTHPSTIGYLSPDGEESVAEWILPRGFKYARGGSVQGNTTWRPMELDGIIGYITE